MDSFLDIFAIGVVILVVYELLESGALGNSTSGVTVPSLQNPGAIPTTAAPNLTSLLGNFFGTSGQGTASSVIGNLPTTLSGSQLIPNSNTTGGPDSSTENLGGSVASDDLGYEIGD